jgi:hypothetical protein
MKQLAFWVLFKKHCMFVERFRDVLKLQLLMTRVIYLLNIQSVNSIVYLDITNKNSNIINQVGVNPVPGKVVE